MHIFNELWAILSGALFFLFCWFLLSFSSLDSYLTLVGWQKNIFNNFGMHTAHSAHYCCQNPAEKLILVFALCMFLICTSSYALLFFTRRAIERSKILGLRKEVAWINKFFIVHKHHNIGVDAKQIITYDPKWTYEIKCEIASMYKWACWTRYTLVRNPESLETHCKGK